MDTEAKSSGRGPAVGRLVWDQEVGSSILPAPTRYKIGVKIIDVFKANIRV